MISLLALMCVTALIVLPAFEALEAREMGRNWSRADRTINARASSLLTRAYDWSEWDDLYTFVQDHNQAFLQSNFTESTLVDMEISAFSILDRDGQIVHEETNTGSRRYSSFGDHFLKSLGEIQPDGLYSGLTEFEGRVFLFSLRPILKTGGDGISNGYLLWAEELDPKAVRRLSDQLELDFSIERGVQVGETSLLSFSRNSDHEVIVAGDLEDFHGVARWTLEVEEPREIFLLGKQTLAQMALVQALIVLVTLSVLAWLLQRLIVKRLVRMNQEVEAIDQNHGEGFIQVIGSDEISRLGAQINQMLGALRDAAHEVEGQRSELIEINSSLERIVLERTRSLEQMNGVLQHALDGIGELTADGLVCRVNSTFAEILGGEGFFQRSFEEWLEPESVVLWRQAVKRLEYDSRVEVELKVESVNHGTLEMQCVLIGIGDEVDGLQSIHIFTKDVTETRAMQRDMVEQARLDPLTGLGNRRFLHDRLVHHLTAPSGEVGVLFVDLDNFKLINDTRGHKVGDRLLKSVSELMQQVSGVDTEIARMGGDEFTLLLTGENVLNRSIDLAGRLQETFESPVDIGDSLAYVSCSIGIAIGGAGVATPTDLIRDADTAMYQAKANGKAGFMVYDDAMNALVHERLEIEVGLRDALERGEFVLLYQPLIDMDSGDVVGVEALVRWMHPTLGAISPVRFIPVAEETGLIIPIGAWVLEEALRATNHLNEILGYQLQMNVNLSQRQVMAENISHFVQKTFEEAGVDPAQVTLEVTESMAMEDIERSIEVLNSLKAVGVGLAVDDFGTGFSSLSYLQKLPVDKVKIDRSFVQCLGRDSRHTNVVTAIIQLCSALDLRVVAEGIETEEQYHLLRDLGCSIGQGFYFARPLSLKALSHYILERAGGMQDAA